ncbi:MAG: hypothetical protein EOM66_09005, partial [Clostridia bacterium]|nr:hypothetical protein [Clostridia bacterium]
MSSINLYGYTTQRISGLASGMDTDTIVENLLAAEQAKLNKVYQQKEKAQWKYDAYSELNSAVSSLRSSYLSVLGDNSLLKSSTYNAYTVNMEENSAIKVTGTTNALSSSFQVLSTTKAAAASRTSQVETQQTEIKGLSGQYLRAQVQGAIALEEGQTISETTTIGDLAAQFGLQDGESLSFSINGETFTLAQDTSLEALVGEVNASAAAASMEIDYATGTVAFASKTIGTETKLEFSNITGAPFSSDGGFGLENADVHKESILGNAGAELDIASATFQDLAEATGLELTGNSFSVNGEAFDITDKSIQTVMDEVNARLEGVTMSYDENDGAFVLRNEPGANATASIQVSGALFGEDSLFGTEEGTYTDSGSVKREDTIAEAVRKLGETVEDEIKL